MAVEASTAAKFKDQHLQFWQLMIAWSVAGFVKHLRMFPEKDQTDETADQY
ncbi:hypothetical protein ARALYDRAFT_917118 [Arabidopsis lyrata subsp. lyrata]|uniref:Uncharacterized protein n=1 Tax=Arabidopsis lyrata subsp. lyrata TaxID=81972 RepID=D7MLJ0_ARALL|nr:hypothetical protein ARALYDRAFT_917118 [Arabidopsis lyrata subsp. lyrata]